MHFEALRQAVEAVWRLCVPVCGGADVTANGESACELLQVGNASEFGARSSRGERVCAVPHKVRRWWSATAGGTGGSFACGAPVARSQAPVSHAVSKEDPHTEGCMGLGTEKPHSERVI